MASRDKKLSKASSSRSGKIRTLSDLNRHSADSDSDSDGPQEYYTGGEKSGMLVQDPTKSNDVDSIFNQARQLGAIERPLDQLEQPRSTSFTGTSRLLSGDTINPPQQQQPEAIIHNIVFWSNGFTINNGPLRRLEDPENAAFLESIKRSECPKELEPADRRSSVNVNLIRRNEKYPEPEHRQIPFQGVGRTLGSISSSAASESSAASTPLGTAAPPSVDTSLPSTSIQVRLSDGSRMVAKLNLRHTVNDIRAVIDASRPGGPTNYQLQVMGFPPKLLTDPTQTIEQAGLANSVVIQKF